MRASGASLPEIHIRMSLPPPPVSPPRSLSRATTSPALSSVPTAASGATCSSS